MTIALEILGCVFLFFLTRMLWREEHELWVFVPAIVIASAIIWGT